MADSQTIEMSCLGRPFQLGMLYDCRRDALIPGVTLWDMKTLKDNISVQTQPKTDFKIIASDSTDDKSEALQVSASLEASFLCGLVSVKGSAEFLHNKKKSMQQSRVTLQFRGTTHFEQLTMEHLGTGNIQHQDVFQQGLATHVVTAILYGAQAFFVFDREVSSSENHQDIQGSLQASIKKIPFIQIEGQASLDMTEEEKKEANKFSCTFHGDFALQRNPITFTDAIRVCAELPGMLGNKGEGAVPMTVWLYPLIKLDSAATRLVREISISLVKRSQSIMDELDHCDVRCQDLMKTKAAMKFCEIKNKLKRFQDLCSQFKLVFQKRLCQLLPSIRGGGKEEQDLATALENRERSPFCRNLINAYLANCDREINVVESFLKTMEAVPVITSSSQLDKLILDFNNKYVVVFALSSLEEKQNYISDLENFLKESSSNETPVPYKPDPSDASNQWFRSKEVMAISRQNIQLFLGFYQANCSREDVKFCIASIPDANNAAVSIQVFEDGELLSSQFELPSKPSAPGILSVEHDCVHIKTEPLLHGSSSIESYCLLYQKTNDSTWTTAVLDKNSTTFAIKQLELSSDYQLKLKAFCRPGESASSDVVRFKTLPCSPPGVPMPASMNSQSISIFWDVPRAAAKDIKEPYFVVEFRKNSEEDACWESIEAKDKMCTVTRLADDTAYSFRVSVKTANKEKSLPSAESVLHTIPLLEEVSRKSLSSDKNPFIHRLVSQSYLKKPKHTKEKVIMVVGTDQSANSSVCDLMANYILGVKWENDYRIRLLPNNTIYNEILDEYFYAPDQLNSYELHHRRSFQVPFSVTVTDTLRFGSETAEFEVALEKIKRFLQKSLRADHVDVICFVFQDSIKPLHKSMYDAILSLFPQDITKNLVIFLTSKDQKVLEAIQHAGMHFPKREDGLPLHFMFNNTPLFQPKMQKGHSVDDNDRQMQIEWTSNFKQMKDFFKAVEVLESQDITAMRRVLPDRGPQREYEISIGMGPNQLPY